LAGTSRTLSDQDLAAATLQGDRRAFGELICRYRDGVVNVVYRMCGDPELAEDAAQEAWIKAWQNMGSYKPEYPFRGWIYRIAMNQSLDVLRRSRKTIEIDSPVLENRLRSDLEGPEETLVKQEQADRVRRALLRLPETGRAVLVLREYQDLSYLEIAAALNIPVGTVMSRLSSARGQLRKLLLEDRQALKDVGQEVICAR
jgi:RNA polymerase sigma-70 factor, ECF subfamily